MPKCLQDDLIWQNFLSASAGAARRGVSEIGARSALGGHWTGIGRRLDGALAEIFVKAINPLTRFECSNSLRTLFRPNEPDRIHENIFS